MGYFSGKALDGWDDDKSMPNPEMLLKMHLSEFSERHTELLRVENSEQDMRILSYDEIMHVLPEHFSSRKDVERAIDIARFDLLTRYGILTEDPIKCDDSSGTNCEGQLNLNLRNNVYGKTAA